VSGGATTRLTPIDVSRARWTSGFGKQLFDKCRTASRETLRMALWHPSNSAAFENFKTAARLKAGRAGSATGRNASAGSFAVNPVGSPVAPAGSQAPYGAPGGVPGSAPGADQPRHQGAYWSDGDCYKYIEGLSYIFGATREPQIKKEIDELLAVIVPAQEDDGYINTQIQIPGKSRWVVRRHHEDYNLGHLFTAASVHFACTGDTTFLDVARRAADCLYRHFMPRQRDAGQFGWNPTHIPGLADLHRATGDRRYLELASVFLDRRGSERPMMPEPGDDSPDDENQMAVPFREETDAVGHSDTACYLYQGAVEVYAANGDRTILDAATRIWRDITQRKMSLTGGVGPLAVGISKRGHRVWEAFAREYDLPHRLAYNETCSNIVFGMLGKAMLEVTGEAQYADQMERVVYNSGISGVSADGSEFCYANPLRWYQQWDTGEEKFGTMRNFTNKRWKIHTCYCCPPQAFRFMAQISGWAYFVSTEGLHVALYGGSEAAVDIPGAGRIAVRQETAYPWDGRVTITVAEAPAREVGVRLRIPGWCQGAGVKVNGKPVQDRPEPGSFFPIRRTWKPGDTIELDMPMAVQLITANPKVEQCRGQAAVQRGPVIYCAEALDLPVGVALEDVGLKADFGGTARFEQDLLGGVVTITGRGVAVADPSDGLYRPAAAASLREIPLKLIPYFAWNNRGHADMTVWLPVR
jgi:uncharacterized protein